MKPRCDFPGGVKTLCFHFRGHRLDPWLGSYMPCGLAKKKKKKKERSISKKTKVKSREGRASWLWKQEQRPKIKSPHCLINNLGKSLIFFSLSFPSLVQCEWPGWCSPHVSGGSVFADTLLTLALPDSLTTEAKSFLLI